MALLLSARSVLLCSVVRYAVTELRSFSFRCMGGISAPGLSESGSSIHCLQVLRSIGEGPGSQRLPAGHVRQIGAEEPLRSCSGDRVAVHAGIVLEDRLPCQLLRCQGGRWRRPAPVVSSPRRRNRPANPRIHAAASSHAGFRSTARIDRGKCPASAGRSTSCSRGSESGPSCPPGAAPSSCGRCPPRTSSSKSGIGCAGSLTGTCSSFAVTIPSEG
jgi:hypothetical protein